MATKHQPHHLAVPDYATLRPSSAQRDPDCFKTEEDEDRDLGTEYIVVEKGSVEINAMVDGLSSSPQKPMSLGRRMSRGFMVAKPTLTGLSLLPHRTTSSGSPPHPSLATHSHRSPVLSFPPRPHPMTASPVLTGSHPMNIANFGRSSPSSQGPSTSSTSNPATFSGPVGAFITSSPSSYHSFDPSTSSSSCYNLHHSSTLNTPSSAPSKPPSGQLAPAAGQALLLYIKALAFLNKSIRHAVWLNGRADHPNRLDLRAGPG
ncbi:Serine/threonine-protein kinase [Puccinia graminis f. sp. tritici]|uniref:Serine/threonine-protein kinase n=1 Tax=Puccinia graminis f. sp. tritici TaxID=56615 RepID=A0A5B0Q3X1_PUCGR|nr:Serine/threonine-protein kinase [Puccinia graminis f. sp. tritici]